MNNQVNVIKRLPHDYDTVVAKLIFIVPGTDPVAYYCCSTQSSAYYQCKNIANIEFCIEINKQTFYFCPECWNGPKQLARRFETMMQDKLLEQQENDAYVLSAEYKKNQEREKAVALDKKRKYISGSVKLRADAKIIKQADTEVSKSRKKFKNAATTFKRATKKRRLNEQEDDELCRQSNLGSREEDSDVDMDENLDEALSIDSPLSKMTMNGSLRNGGRG